MINSVSQIILLTSILIFTIGVIGLFLVKKNIIILLICLELLFLAVNLNFIMYSLIWDDITGQIFSLFVLTLAGCEASLGLAILIIFYRIRGIITVSNLNSLKG